MLCSHIIYGTETKANYNTLQKTFVLNNLSLRVYSSGFPHTVSCSQQAVLSRPHRRPALPGTGWRASASSPNRTVRAGAALSSLARASNAVAYSAWISVATTTPAPRPRMRDADKSSESSLGRDAHHAPTADALVLPAHRETHEHSDAWMLELPR
jgi:hypothetical protein